MAPSGEAEPGPGLRLGGRSFAPGRTVVMAVLNRTPDPTYPGARQLDDDVAHAAADEAVAAGADILDIGGVKAGPGEPVSSQQEVFRVVGFLEVVRARHPRVVLSVDTWRAEVAEQACAAGAGLVDDTWAGHDPELVHVAARHGAGYVVSHTGERRPRTRPSRVTYGSTADGVVADVVATPTVGAARAVAAGVDPRSVLVDPTHDFGKNTWHSLTLVRRTDAVAAIRYPVLSPRATRRALDVVEAVRGGLVPPRALRGLA